MADGHALASLADATRTARSPGALRHAALALMAASGVAALGLQIVWTQQCALWLGHEAAAVLAVVGAFFGGLAVGALMLGTRIARSACPARWYAACEAVIGVWSAALVLAMPSASTWLLAVTGAQPSAVWQWGVTLAGSFVLLLPATAAMGATLPAMERVMTAARREGASIAALYASNTFGAVLGVLAAAFWWLPQIGLARTAIVCVGFNLLAAAVAWVLLSRNDRADAVEPHGEHARLARRPLVLLAATGLLGIGYEVLMVRVLSQLAENTVYTFAMLLAVYLAGTAAGAAAYARSHAAARGGDEVRDRLLVSLCAACLLGALALRNAPLLKATSLQVFGAGMAGALAAEATLALIAFAPATLVMGALFSHLGTQARAVGVGLGVALGVNTLGGALAPLLFGVVAVPMLGPKVALLLIAGGYLALSSLAAWRSPIVWILAGAALALGTWAPPLTFVDVPEGGHIVSYREGAMAAVSVVEDADGVARLRIDNRQQEGSSATLQADARQALLPLLLHPAPRQALFLGLGTGVTASSATMDAALSVDAVELLPEVIDASRHFTGMFDSVVPAGRLHVMAADARRYVRTSAKRYDLIVADNFHPARSGSGALYTVEHFQAVRSRLAAEGLFCQWLPLHQLDLDTLRSIVRSFIAVFPNGWAMLATYSLDTPVLGLVARRDGEDRFSVARLHDRLSGAALARRPADFGLVDELALLGGFVAGPASLARFAGNSALNTDDHPVVAYRAPRITYAPDSLARDRLLALLRELTIAPGELIDAATDSDWSARLQAYWSARDRFIAAGRAVQPTPDVRRMLSQVRQPLLTVLRTSPDFRPAYDPLLRMALALAGSDTAGARQLLGELARVQPARPEAAQALRELSDRSL
jgi:spermidine synthase